MTSDSLVLVLGAGASLGARHCSATRPPLGAGLAGYISRWLRANDPSRPLRIADAMLHPPASECPLYTGEELWRVEHLADVADAIDRVADQERTSTSTVGTPFEALMNSWVDAEDDRSDYIRCAQRILAMSMLVGRECAFHERPDLFDELLARLVGRRRLMVISLNYDSCLRRP
jgi:hypothetical protein